MTDTVACIIRSLSHFNYIFITFFQSFINQINSLWDEIGRDNKYGDNFVCVVLSITLQQDYYTNRVGSCTISCLSYILERLYFTVLVLLFNLGPAAKQQTAILSCLFFPRGKEGRKEKERHLC